MQSIKELKNIPIAISVLHEQEYNNLYNILYNKFNKDKRRANSEKSKNKNDKVQILTNKTLKN